jgi:hypothetical protein
VGVAVPSLPEGCRIVSDHVAERGVRSLLERFKGKRIMTCERGVEWAACRGGQCSKLFSMSACQHVSTFVCCQHDVVISIPSVACTSMYVHSSQVSLGAKIGLLSLQQVLVSAAGCCTHNHNH